VDEVGVAFSWRWGLGGRLAHSFETLGVSSAWDVHGMHPGWPGDLKTLFLDKYV